LLIINFSKKKPQKDTGVQDFIKIWVAVCICGLLMEINF